MKVSPNSAAFVIQKFQGVRKAARALGRNASTVSRWQKSSEMGGAGGRVPAAMVDTILEKSLELDLGIGIGDLIEMEA